MACGASPRSWAATLRRHGSGPAVPGPRSTSTGGATRGVAGTKSRQRSLIAKKNRPQCPEGRCGQSRERTRAGLNRLCAVDLLVTSSARPGIEPVTPRYPVVVRSALGALQRSFALIYGALGRASNPRPQSRRNGDHRRAQFTCNPHHAAGQSDRLRKRNNHVQAVATSRFHTDLSCVKTTRPGHSVVEQPGRGLSHYLTSKRCAYTGTNAPASCLEFG